MNLPFKKTFQKVFKADNKTGSGAQLLRAVILGLLVTVAMLLLFSFVLSKWDIPFELINTLAIFSLILGCAISGYYIASKKKEKGMILGAISGAIIFFILFAVAVFSGSEVGLMAITKLVIAVTSGAIGGVIGVNRKQKSRLA